MDKLLSAAMQRSLAQVMEGDPFAATTAIQTALGAKPHEAPPRPERKAGVRRGPVGRSLGDVMAELRAMQGGHGASLRAEPALPSVPERARFERHRFACRHGARDYWLYTPATHREEPKGLIVMLHGCTQTAIDFAVGTAMNEAAERHGFAVVYPEQSRSDNASSCWNWFRPSDQGEGRGEPALLASLAVQLSGELGVRKERVFAAGLSAGGAMAAILGDTQPEVFGAVGIHSGLAAGSAHDMPSAFEAMRGGAGTRARALRCPAIVFHGTRDTTVSPSNADNLTGKMAHEEERHVTLGGRAVQVTFGRSATGDQMELWKVEGAGHAWSGGNPKGSFADQKGPDASAEMIRFFLRQP